MVRIQDINPGGGLEGTIYVVSFALGTTLVIGLDERDVITWATQYFGPYYGPYECVETNAAEVECMLIQQCLIHNTGASFKKRSPVGLVDGIVVDS